MTTLVENPVPVILVGIFVEALLGIALFRTGRGVVLWAMLGVLAVVLAGVGLEWLVATDREQVEATLDGAAAALAANPTGAQRTRMLDRYISPSATATRALLAWGLNRVTFTKVKINHLEISINDLTSPPTADVELSGYVGFKDRKGEYPYEGQPVKFTMQLRREQPDRWQISGHTWHDDPR